MLYFFLVFVYIFIKIVGVVSYKAYQCDVFLIILFPIFHLIYCSWVVTNITS